MDKEKMAKLFKWLLIIFIMIQPILDLYWLYEGMILKIGGFIFPTIVRIGFIGLLGVLSFFVIKFNKKYLWLILYGGLILLYVIIHCYNAGNFNSLVPGNFNYSLVEELFYIIRMLMPIIVIYLTYNSKITKKDFDKTIIVLALLMAGSIVITNLLKISFGSYNDETIAYNIFDWFTNKNAGYRYTASRGFFFSSRVTATMIIITPYIFCKYYETNKFRYLGLIVLLMLALLMVGTKATNYSFLLISGAMLLVYLFTTLILKKQHFKIPTAVLSLATLLICIVMIPISPSTNRTNTDTKFQSDQQEKDKAGKFTKEDLMELGIEGDYETLNDALLDMSEEKSKEVLISYFDKYHDQLGINEKFILQSYPYKYDPVFWYKLVNDYPFWQKVNSRFVQQEIFSHVKNINNNNLDDFFGITFSRASNIYTLEKDFVYHYYTLGIVGTILLLGPFMAIIFFAMFMMLKKWKHLITIENCAFVLGIGLTLFVAYYSGNVMDTLGVTIVLGCVTGYLLKNILVKE